MDKRVLKWATICSVMLTILICIGLYMLPSWEKELLAVLGLMEEEAVVEIQESTTVQEQLNIEIPENMDGKDITITNDYLTQTIYVRFAQGVDDYSEKYSVKGGSDHISHLSYYRDGEAGNWFG